MGKPLLRNITADEAVEYVRSMSVKLFPTQAKLDPDRMYRFLTRAPRPVVMLKRDEVKAHRSRMRAKRENKWNDDFKGERQEEPDLEDGDDIDPDSAGKRNLRYFEKAREMLREMGRSWAEVDYENIVNQRIIWLGDCWVRNCNFIYD